MSNTEYILIIAAVGLVSSLNPLLISVYSKKVVADFGLYTDKTKLLLNSLFFVFGLVLSILIASKTIFYLLSNIESYNFYFVTILVAVLSILFGSLKIVSYILKKPLYPIPSQTESLVHTLSFKKNNLLSSFLLGLVMIVVLASSLGIVLVLLNSLLIINNQILNFGWALAFALASVFTLLGLLVSVLISKRVVLIVKWNEDNRYTLRLYSGLTQIILAWIFLVQIIGARY